MNSALASLVTRHSSLLGAIGYFESSPKLAVAVSGGADSMALLLLADQWAKQHAGSVAALTVDHGLRPESADEAKLVQGWCCKRAIEHHILKVQDSEFSIPVATQEAARYARYALLAQWCKKNHVLHLLTGHHQDDQAETFFFRLSRGSGIDGMAAMPMVSSLHGVRLLRPLLNVPKTQLKAMLTDIGQDWIEDTSNRNPRYTRNRIRTRLAQAENAAEISERAAKIADRFGKIRNRLEHALARHLVKATSIFPEGYGIIDYESFRALPPEFGVRALSALILALNGETYPPRSEKLTRLYYELVLRPPLSLHPNRGGIYRRTFNGLLFIGQPKKKRLLVCREPNAIQAALPFTQNIIQHWDNRFQVSCRGDGGALSVRALGCHATLLNKTPAYKMMEKSVLSALPSFWNLEELVSVPHMGYNNPHYRDITCSAHFIPAKALAGVAFFSMTI